MRGASKPPFEIVAIAASAGGLNALTRILSTLPATFDAGIVVVPHLDPRHRSLMAAISGRRWKGYPRRFSTLLAPWGAIWPRRPQTVRFAAQVFAREPRLRLHGLQAAPQRSAPSKGVPGTLLEDLQLVPGLPSGACR